MPTSGSMTVAKPHLIPMAPTSVPEPLFSQVPSFLAWRFYEAAPSLERSPPRSFRGFACQSFLTASIRLSTSDCR